ncbi:cbb3-type cytochrome c oxidase subunit II [Luteolibacter marinus]|uniref:cbb3-type cytochrome c oxidase subunit II n=1 Tax=Luteolibacter marinus TaxID=2776705 RepID=UPI0018677C97|nr:cbb3-type cytochrome c oxidase subunit II [Luteolibacter marinus]
MSFRQFAFGLTATFGFAWLAVVIVPFFMMRSVEPVAFTEAADGKEGIYHPKTTGRVTNGAEVYASNGCYNCHTQLIRPTYAGNELGRPDWAGLKMDEERGDTRRESNVFDYQGEKFAQIGLNRLGPDLSNVGRRVEAEYAKGGDAKLWLMMHLYDPRANPQRPTSTCPSHRFLFEEKEVLGQVPQDALPVESPEGTVVIPSPDANELVDYLLSLKRDDAVPASMNYGPATKPAEAKPAAPQG